MKRQSTVSRVNFIGDISFVNLLDWLVTLVLTAILAVTTLQLGGARAETQLMFLWLMGGLLVLHAFWLLLQRREKKLTLRLPVLIFAPFLLYLWFSWQVLTPTPWAGRGDVLLAFQAFLLLWVTAHNLRTRNHVWFLFGALGMIALISVLMAYNQYFRDPDWLPELFNPLEGRSFKISGHAQYFGRASGSFGAPNTMAGFMLLAFFPAALVALTKSLSPILRVFAGYLALMFLSGLVLTISRGGLLVLVVGLVLLPWFCGFKRRTSLLCTVGLLLAFAAAAASLFFCSPRFRERWGKFSEDGGERTRPAMWQAAWETFQEHPVLGSGVGSYRYYLDLHREEGFTASPLHAHNDYLEMASDLGVVGLILFFAPVLWLAWSSWRAWRSMPDRIALDEVQRNRRRLRVMPAEKVFMGAALLSLFALALHLTIEFHLHLPALLFWSAFFVGILFKCLPERGLVLKAGRPRLLYAAGFACVGLLLPTMASRGYVAEIYLFEGNRLTDVFSRDFTTVRYDRKLHDKRLKMLRLAVERNPQQAEAQALLALAIADLSYLESTRRMELGQEAEQHARLAVEAFPEATLYQIYLGEALFLQERWGEAGAAYQRAVELSPNNDVAWYYYANWLNGEPGRREEALAAIDRSLELDPDDSRAQSLRLKILIP